MKPSIAFTLGGGAFAVMMGAYLFAYATTPHDPVEWKNGDLILQDSKAEQILPLFAADGSGATHIGIVEVTPQGAVVIEAAETVVATPVHTFIARGENKAISVYRLESLSEEQGSAVVAAARRQMGKPNDFFLRKSWDGLYSSELVRLAYSDIGLDLGRTQKFATVAEDLGMVRSQFMRSWSSNVDCQKRQLTQSQCWDLVRKQEVITPSSIVADARMTQVYATAKTEPAGFTLSRAKDPKDAPSKP